MGTDGDVNNIMVNNIMVNNINNNNKPNLSNGGNKLDNSNLHHQHHNHQHHHHHQQQQQSQQFQQQQSNSTNGSSSSVSYAIKTSQIGDSTITGISMENGVRNSREDINSSGTIREESLNGSNPVRLNGGGISGLPINMRGKSPNSYFSDLPDRGNPGGGIIRIMNEEEDDDGLGPLPVKWEKAYTENGETYFIDNNTGTSHWLDPRLSKFQKKSLEDCLDDELPYGWEKIHDPQYGTYFIDHVNRRTQYENPVLQAKRRVEQTVPKNSPKSIFTRNPAELFGERVTTTLLKSSRGLGFTIVGGDDNVEEFLQIKSIVPNGPAWLDGKLQMGDILVYVNDTCVLGFTHHEMVNVFQSILPGETVTLEVCRGYPLPFDPNDPNTEVVTTIAVDGISTDPEKARILLDLNMDGNYNFLDISDPLNAHTNGITNGIPGIQKNPLSKIQSGSIRSDGSDTMSNEMNRIVLDKPEMLTISINKGNMGFGFTIADSAHGQKVKKILDRNCCKNLIEGDILLNINAVNVKNMSHSDVVQVLKDCAKGQEAVLKVQRVPHYSTVNLAAKANSKLRKAANNGAATKDPLLFRSKTPTADLYSTQPKEILPTRPKTPLVDTRERNNKTPLNLEINTDEVDKNEDVKGGGGTSDTKSNNSLHDQDSITNDIPSMDPFPKFVTHLAERLAQTTMIHDHPHNLYHNPSGGHGFSSQSDLNTYDQPINNSDYYNYTTVNGNGGVNYSNVYSPPAQIPIMAPVPTYHQDTCYCYECQDYNRQQQEYIMQQQYYLHNSQATKMKLLDRRKMAGFTPLENASYPSPPQHPQQQYWKYGHPSPGGGGGGGQPELLQPIGEEEYSLSEVTLERQTLGFGFRIVGGTEEGSQVTVGHIVPSGSADKDPRIQTGDEILSIDGVNVVGASHHRVVQLMGEAALRGQVTMILRRRSQRIMRYPYDVIVSRNENEGFGFVVISSSNQYYGSTIGKLIAGSPADQCGELKVGDRIIAVNRIDIIGMSHGDVVNLIKESGLHVRLTIGNPRDPNVLNQQQQQQQQQLQQQQVGGGGSAAGGNAGGVKQNDPYFERYNNMGSQPHL